MENTSPRAARAEGVNAPLEPFIYPLLSKFCEQNERERAASVARLTRTYNDLERIIRQGAAADAQRAAIIARAYKIALTLLEELKNELP